jgi:hypothetical protein
MNYPSPRAISRRPATMHTFTILRATAQQADVGSAFQALNVDLSTFVVEELDLAAVSETFGGINNQYLALSHLSRHPAVGLRNLGCTNVDELMQASGYYCGFMGDNAIRYSLVPLGVVTSLPGLQKYGEAFDEHNKDGTTSQLLHLVPDSDRFIEDAMAAPELGLQPSCQVTSYEQLYFGSGYTREMLAGGQMQMQLCPVWLSLSNGDRLLAYAYRLSDSIT